MAKKILAGTATTCQVSRSPGLQRGMTYLIVQLKVFQLLFESNKAVQIMKTKLFLPLLALVLALASAFAPVPPNQMAWYKDTSVVPPTVQQGTITIPSDTDAHPCAVGRTNICQVGSFNAHSTEAGANTNNPLTLLKYD